MRLGVITTHPVQYQSPIWRGLALMPGADVHVFYGSDASVRGYVDKGFGTHVKWDVPLTEGFPHSFLPTNGKSGKLDSFFGLRADGLEMRLKGFKPDAILLTAYTPFFYWRAFYIAHRMGVPVILRTEATDDALRRGVIKRYVRKAVLSLVYSQVHSCLAIGQNARKHYLSHGVDPKRIGWSPYAVDTSMFEAQRDEFRNSRAEIRAELGVDGSHTVFLFSGKVIPKKDPLTLAKALVLMAEEVRNRCALLVIGDGELRSRLDAMCSEVLGRRYKSLGFVNQRAMGKYYTAADCLVLPSAWGETWGLVVNEALQFGVPAIVSDRVGCAPDLIATGETGDVFPTGDPGALCRRLSEMVCRTPSQITKMETLCRLKIASYSTQSAVAGIYSAITEVAGGRR